MSFLNKFNSIIKKFNLLLFISVLAVFDSAGATDVAQLEKDIQVWISNNNFNLPPFNDGAAQIITDTLEVVSQLTDESQLKNIKNQFKSFCSKVNFKVDWNKTQENTHNGYCRNIEKIVWQKISSSDLDKNSFEILTYLASTLNYKSLDRQILFSDLLHFNPIWFIELDLVMNVIFKDPNIKDYVFKLIIEHLHYVEAKSNCLVFLKKSIANNREYSTLLLKQIKKENINLLQSYGGIDLYDELLKNDPSSCLSLEHAIIQHIETVHPKALMLLHKHTTTDKTLKKALKRYIKNNKTVDVLVKVWLYNFSCKNDALKIKRKVTTPTEQHLKHFRSLDMYGGIEDYLDNILIYKDDKTLQAMVLQIISKEKLLQRDYYTFVHGQRLHYLFLEQLHTFLYKELNNLMIGDFLLLHIKKADDNKKSEKRLRNTILAKGRDFNGIRDRLLFTNYAFFGNLTNAGSCSAQYIANNDNISNFNFTIKDVFALHNLTTLYNKYDQQLRSLYDQFNKLSKYGACILIAIPKKTAHKQVYIAEPGGYKKKVELRGANPITDIHTLADYLQNKPETIFDIDNIEFCILMTFDKKGGLNPESGIKFFSYIAADPQALSDYYKAQERIFNQIKNDIKNEIKTIRYNIMNYANSKKEQMTSFLTNLYTLLNWME